ncbi:hypothetical protein HK107_13480 [Parvularcula sp. ZS-1/3]|uniref:Uncharacterized protein n=1 Tax=Parvularcula mediterranea TaxID=2732508 RepID=A0A7Y3RQ64_9PROT|nr:hypothetical protein [Parvularcula mediterranea]NNU17337.1 hypothetical protein [Parvularcula mediterranea]
MKPNFHAIGALTYGLQFGFTAIPAALRRGWLSLIIVIAALGAGYSALSETGVLELMLGGWNADTTQLEEFFEGLEDMDDEMIFANEEFGDFMGAWFFITFAQLAATIMFIPALVDLYRKAAGLEERPGFLPGFGNAEWALFAAVIILFFATLFYMGVASLPVIGLIIFGVQQSQPILIFLGGLLAVAAVVWFPVRAQLIPIHSALSGRIAFMEGFNLTGGRFWKFLGLLILAAIVVHGVMAFAVSLLQLALFSMGQGAVALLIYGLFYVYAIVAMAGIFGRVTGELMGFDPEGGEAAAAADDGFGGDDDFSDDGETFADDVAEAPETVETAEETLPRDFAGDERRSFVEPQPMVRRAADTAPAEESSPWQRPTDDLPKNSIMFVRNRFRR